MWNNISLGTFLPNIDISHFLPSVDASQFLPAVPTRFMSSVGSTFIATATGYTYGLVGRILYPNTGISPLHYATWFTLAFQIQQFVFLIEINIHDFLGVRSYLEELENVSEDELDLSDLVRYYCWEIIQIKNQTVQAIDGVFVRVLNIRPYDEINSDNVEEASFFEMCRYRMWPVFKLAVLETVSFSLAYRLCNSMGFSLPARTAVPLIVVISSIVKDIILIPALHCYVHWCNEMANKVEDGNEEAFTYRAKWFRSFLPSL